MSRFQRFIKAVFPRSWFEAAAAESRTWYFHCPCGAEVSIWDLGGLRWKGKSKTARLSRCKSCGKITWQKLIQHPA